MGQRVFWGINAMNERADEEVEPTWEEEFGLREWEERRGVMADKKGLRKLGPEQEIVRALWALSNTFSDLAVNVGVLMGMYSEELRMHLGKGEGDEEGAKEADSSW